MRSFLKKFNPFVLGLAIYSLALEPALAEGSKGPLPEETNFSGATGSVKQRDMDELSASLDDLMKGQSQEYPIPAIHKLLVPVVTDLNHLTTFQFAAIAANAMKETLGLEYSKGISHYWRSLLDAQALDPVLFFPKFIKTFFAQLFEASPNIQKQAAVESAAAAYARLSSLRPELEGKFKEVQDELDTLRHKKGGASFKPTQDKPTFLRENFRPEDHERAGTLLEEMHVLRGQLAQNAHALQAYEPYGRGYMKHADGDKIHEVLGDHLSTLLLETLYSSKGFLDQARHMRDQHLPLVKFAAAMMDAREAGAPKPSKKAKKDLYESNPQAKLWVQYLLNPQEFTQRFTALERRAQGLPLTDSERKEFLSLPPQLQHALIHQFCEREEIPLPAEAMEKADSPAAWLNIFEPLFNKQVERDLTSEEDQAYQAMKTGLDTFEPEALNPPSFLLSDTLLDGIALQTGNPTARVKKAEKEKAEAENAKPGFVSAAFIHAASWFGKFMPTSFTKAARALKNAGSSPYLWGAMGLGLLAFLPKAKALTLYYVDCGDAYGSGTTVCPPCYEGVGDAPGGPCGFDFPTITAAPPGNATITISVLNPTPFTPTSYANGGTLYYPSAYESCTASTAALPPYTQHTFTCGDASDFNALINNQNLMGVIPGPYVDVALNIGFKGEDSAGASSDVIYKMKVVGIDHPPVITKNFSIPTASSLFQTTPDGMQTALFAVPSQALGYADPDRNDYGAGNVGIAFSNFTNAAIELGGATVLPGQLVGFDDLIGNRLSLSIKGPGGAPYGFTYKVCNIDPNTGELRVGINPLMGNPLPELCSATGTYSAAIPEPSTAFVVKSKTPNLWQQARIPFFAALASAIGTGTLAVCTTCCANTRNAYAKVKERYPFDDKVADELGLQHSNLTSKDAGHFSRLMGEIGDELRKRGIYTGKWAGNEGTYNEFKNLAALVAAAIKQRVDVECLVETSYCSFDVCKGRKNRINFGQLSKSPHNSAESIVNEALALMSAADIDNAIRRSVGPEMQTIAYLTQALADVRALTQTLADMKNSDRQGHHGPQRRMDDGRGTSARIIGSPRSPQEEEGLELEDV